MTANDKPVVHFDVTDGIGVITIDYPPVNALGPGVGDGIIASLEKGEADPEVKAFVLIGAGRSSASPHGSFTTGRWILHRSQSPKPSGRRAEKYNVSPSWETSIGMA